MWNKPKQLTILILWVAITILASGCSMKRSATETYPERTRLPQKKQESVRPVSPKAPPPKTVLPPEEMQPSKELPPPEPIPDARMLATANLVEQGKNYIDDGKPDQALNVLERALSVYPGNGKTYYYMAEAWVMKKNKRQALEFNRLAGMYLSDQEWRDKVADQQNRIKNLP
ncbi:MAG: tetratricopeptide repeat protein [Desulfosalsimonadaceae bacterium]